MKFNIKDFQENSIVKFFYNNGRHGTTSLRLYKGDLFVHKLLGSNYRGVSKKEYLEEVFLIKKLYKFLEDKTDFNLPEIVFVGYNVNHNCIERVEKYSGITLRYAFPTAVNEEREKIAKKLLGQINSLIKANRNKIELDYSIDPTPDNFTYKDGEIYFIDFMPPLIKRGSVDPHLISNKFRSETDLSTQMFRYFNQKGIYLTFLTKFGSVDITYFHKLFKLTLNHIESQEIKNFLYNDNIKHIEDLIKKGLDYGELRLEVKKKIKNYDKSQRDLLRLLGVYFLYDSSIILLNAEKYRVNNVIKFFENKKCAADLISDLIYSQFRESSLHEDFKEMVVELISLQYGQ